MLGCTLGYSCLDLIKSEAKSFFQGKKIDSHVKRKLIFLNVKKYKKNRFHFKMCVF